MAELTYRDAVNAGIAQEMRRDSNVVFLGEDIGEAGGVFKTAVGLFDEFGPDRVRDTPISEQAILGAAMGAAQKVVAATDRKPGVDAKGGAASFGSGEPRQLVAEQFRRCLAIHEHLADDRPHGNRMPGFQHRDRALEMTR